MISDLLRRKATHFLLWRPRNTNPAPKLIIGKLQPGNPPTFVSLQHLDLHLSEEKPDLWQISATESYLAEGEVYHYWFEINDNNPYKENHPRIWCTDPTAWTVDWRLLAPRLPEPFGEDDRDPAGVVKFQDGKLMSSDPGGETVDWEGDPRLDVLPPNNRLVIYELPTSWTRLEELEANVELSVGTFRDVVALIESDSRPSNFSGVAA